MKHLKCPNCQKNKAIKSKEYGYIECKICQKEGVKPSKKYEFTTDSIRDQRKEYAKDIIAPYRDGIISQEYLDEYGASGIHVTKEELKKAEYVWSDVKGKWNRDKSKGGRSDEWRKVNEPKNT